MTAKELLSYLFRQGIELWMEGDRLRYRGVKRTIPPQLVALLRQHKAELQMLLRERKKNSNEPFPLSYTQKAFWFLYQMNPVSTAYIGSQSVTLHGPISPPALHRAFEQLCMRHPSLRTRLVIHDGVPWQQVDAAPACSLGVTDATSWSNEELHEWIQAEVHRPLNLLETATRLHLYQRSVNESVLLLCMHHIHMDGWSLGILLRDFGVLYRSQLSGQPAPLPALPATYSDFVAWQQHLLISPEGESQIMYWVDALVGAPQVLELPTDRPRPKKRSESGARLRRVVDANLSQRAKVLAAQEGTTLNVLLLSVFASLLHRYSGQEEFLIGSPYHGRNERRWEQVLGCFINSLTLRMRFPTGLTFRALLQEVRLGSHEALAHADYPFPLVVERLRPQRDPSRTPLFQVMFGYENFQGADLIFSTLAGEAQSADLDSLFGVPLTPLALSQQEGGFDLSMAATEANGLLCYSLSYSTDLFELRTVEQMASHFEQLLLAITENPEQTIAALPMFSEAERRQLLVDWNPLPTPISEADTFPNKFHEQVARTPDAPAVTYLAETLSYRELSQQAAQLAHRLRQLGVGPEVFVGVCLDRSPRLMVALLGTWLAGGAYVPLDPLLPKERLEYMLQDCAAPIVLTELQYVRQLERPGVTLLLVDDELIADLPTAPPHVGLKASDLAYCIYTSGSTGRPRGVLVEQGSMVHLAQTTRAALRPEGTPALRVSLNASLVFDGSVMQILLLLAGDCLHLLPDKIRVDAAALVAYVRAQRLDLLDCTPTMLTELVANGLLADPDTAPAWLWVGGEAIAESLWETLRAAQRTSSINLYGPTECTVVSTLSDLKQGPPRPVIGKPFGHVRVYILDKQRNLLPMGVPGEVYLSGPGVARGYLNQAKLTAKKFLADPFVPGERMYQSGDRGRWLPDGNIEYLGRLDFQIKLRGYRIELGEIEVALRDQPGVQDCVVVVQEYQPGDKRLVAYLVPETEGALNRAELTAKLRARLSEYMVPALFVTLSAFPRTPTGKLDRQALPVPQGERSVDDSQVPRNATEQALADIFAQILHLQHVGVHENFFSLGGHSLLATQAVSRIQATLGVELSVSMLFAAPTVADLASVITAQGANAAAETTAIARVARGGPLPLSFAQQRLWFLDQLDPGLPLYNIPSALHLRGPLDRECLRLALEGIVGCHEGLRTTFSSREQEPVQIIHPPPSHWPLPLIDLTTLPATSRAAELTRLAEEEARLPFSLERGPLLRTTLLLVSEQEHVLLLTMHHIISDGWSLGVLFRELSALYAALCEHRPANLPVLRAQVVDISAWQRQLLQGKWLQQALSYWKQQLAGCPPLELPTDHPRPPVLSYRGRILTFSLDVSLGLALKALAQSQQATLFMTLLGSFALLLSRYSQQTDIAIGSPIANRTCTEMEPLIGCFVNTLVLRTSLAGNPTFFELLTRVRQLCLDAYSNQQLPFERLVDELHVTRDRSRNPLFQVMLVLQNTPLSELRMLGLESSYLLVHHQTAKFDLTLSLEEHPDGSLTGLFEYATDLFEPTMIERMASHYTRLLQGIVERPDKRIGELPLLTDAERQRLLAQASGSRAEVAIDQALGLAEHFEAQVERTPDAVAVVYEGRRLTYSELNNLANQLAHRLRSQGVGPDGLVALALERSLELVVGLMGILKAGGAFVPLDPAHPKDRIEFVLQDCRPAALITQRSFAGRFDSVSVPVTFLDDPLQLQGYQATNPPPVTSVQHLAYAIYTSGSTGLPKGACISQAAVLNLLHGHRQSAFAGPPMRVAWVSPVVFDASVQILAALLYGHTLYVVSQETRHDAPALLTFLRTHAIELWECTPPLLSLLIDAGLPNEPGLGLRMILCGGEALPVPLVATLYAQKNHPHLTLINAYGPTECCVIATTYTVTAAEPCSDRAVVPIGRPLPNVQVYILDPHLQPVPIGVPGQLYIGGAGLARGYLNRPELTRERFIPNPFSIKPGARLYQTGDLGRFLPDGNLEFLGRIDHQVKLRGFRIELGEIESVLGSHPLVRACAVLAREDSPGDKRLIAYVVLQPGPQPGPTALREHLAAKLPDYMLPAAFVFLDALPQTSNGKLDRQALPAPSYERSPEPFVAARTPLEQTLVEIFAQLLHQDRISIHDNFFSLGGHSLLAVRLFAQLAQRTGRTLPLSTLFQHPTVAGLAAVLKDRAAEPPHQTVLALQSEGSRPPLFCIHPVGGNVLCYVELARALGTAQPVYGVQATPVAADDTEPSETLEAVASRYVTALQKVQPAGPYQLLGWSLGGVLAFEMARQLEKAGQRVALLALLDSYAPGPLRPELQAAQSEAAMLRFFLSDLTRNGGAAAALPPDALTDLRAALSTLRDQGLLPSDTGEAQLAALYALFRRNLRLTLDYQPGRYGGPVLLLQAADSAAADSGWPSLCSGPLELVGLPGDHYTIVSAAAVGAVARLLHARLLGAS